MERDDEVVLRRMLMYENVTAVSAPQDSDSDSDGDSPGRPDLPGKTLQLRLADDGIGYVENAELVEVQDSDL
ncbi:MAG: hypothetical protein ABEI80_03830 [Haloplanus sp.]